MTEPSERDLKMARDGRVQATIGLYELGESANLYYERHVAFLLAAAREEGRREERERCVAILRHWDAPALKELLYRIATKIRSGE